MKVSLEDKRIRSKRGGEFRWILVSPHQKLIASGKADSIESLRERIARGMEKLGRKRAILRLVDLPR